MKSITIIDEIISSIGYDLNRDYYVVVVKPHTNPTGQLYPGYVRDIPSRVAVSRLLMSADEFYLTGDFASGDACFGAATEIALAKGEELPVWPELFADREKCRKGR